MHHHKNDSPSVSIRNNEYAVVLYMSFIRMGTMHADTTCGDILYSFHPSGWLSNSYIVADRK